VGLALVLQTGRLNAREGPEGRAKIFAQKLVETAVAKHPELSGVEMSATPPGGHNCLTIASTETKDLGEKCDEDEFTAMRTGKPFAEKEEDGFDITVPLHDATGKLIGAVGMDFKPEPGQQETGVIEQATRITRELEKKIPSKAALFDPVG
jgi:iron complex outermembrane receptor protein